MVGGRVQGVFFRDSTRERAEDAGVSGWVRNCPDGTVEAVFDGPEEAVARMVDWMREGPSSARVESAQVSDEDDAEQLAGFEVR